MENPDIRAKFREQILLSRPTVVALLLCARDEAERYRAGAEASIERGSFQEEIEDCVGSSKGIVEADVGLQVKARVGLMSLPFPL